MTEPNDEFTGVDPHADAIAKDHEMLRQGFDISDLGDGLRSVPNRVALVLLGVVFLAAAVFVAAYIA